MCSELARGLLAAYSIKIHSHERSKNAREERFPGILVTYFLNNSEMVPVAPIIAGITLVFTFHMCCIYIVRSLYFYIIIIIYPQYETCV
jgi:hypothetical protein